MTGPSGAAGRDPETSRVPSRFAHALDLVFFRALGVGLLYNEARLSPPPDWPLVVAGIWMFFMPDALRGRRAIAARVLLRLLGDKP